MTFVHSNTQHAGWSHWYVAWPLVGAGVALLWLLIDHLVVPALGIARDNLSLMVSLDYVRIFVWPSSLLGIFLARDVAVLTIVIGVIANSVSYLALGWCFKICRSTDKRWLVVPVAFLLLWLWVVFNL